MKWFCDTWTHGEPDLLSEKQLNFFNFTVFATSLFHIVLSWRVCTDVNHFGWPLCISFLGKVMWLRLHGFALSPVWLPRLLPWNCGDGWMAIKTLFWCMGIQIQGFGIYCWRRKKKPSFVAQKLPWGWWILLFNLPKNIIVHIRLWRALVNWKPNLLELTHFTKVRLLYGDKDV